MSKNKLIGLISALAIMLMPNITDPKALGQLLFNQNVTNAFLAYSRLISPQVHSLFLFSFFLSFWMFLDKKKWVYGIVSGILSGLLFYTYPFAWMFVGSFFTFLLLIYIFRKKWIDIRNIFLISLVAFMVASPFLFNLIQAMNDPAYEDVSLRYGWVESRAPQIGVTVLVLLGIFLLFFPKKEKKIYDFSLSIVLAPLILLNQQVITGYLLGPARYHHYYYKPFAVVFLFIILYSFLKKPLFKVLVVLVLLIGFYNAYLVQTFSYKTYESLGIENQRYGTVFNWLNENGNKDESVVANPYLSDLIPIYTSLNVPLNLDAHYSLTSNEDLLERMFFSYRLNNVGGENIKETFYQNRERISKDIFAQRHHKEFGSYEAIPDEQLDLFIKGYGRSLEIPTEDMFEKLKVDYVVWDTKSDPIWNIDQYPFLNLVYEDKGFKIYEFNQR